MSMQVSQVIEFLHNLAPPGYQESYDNSGLLVGDASTEVKAVLVSLDCTEDVLNEALELNANLIVSHHPIIFGGLKKLTGTHYVERVVMKAIKNDLNLFAIHTNLDNVYQNGVNLNIANKLKLINTSILAPKSEELHEGHPVGAGITGELVQALDEQAFLHFLKEQMQVSCIKHTRLLDKPIKKVSICGGSGRFLLETAIDNGSDIFISSDFKYHDYFEADDRIVIADIGHYESEQFTSQMLCEILTNKFNTFASHYTKVDTNPVNYF